MPEGEEEGTRRARNSRGNIKATGGEGAQAPALCQSRCPLQLLETQGWSRKCEEEGAVERNHYVPTISPKSLQPAGEVAKK